MNGRRWIRLVGPARATLTFFAASCEGKFEGPYPCAPGFASCTTPNDNECETLISSDGANCGTCQHRCSPGAACTTWCAAIHPGIALPHAVSVRAHRRRRRARLGDGQHFEHGGGTGSVETVSTAGGTPTTLAALSNPSSACGCYPLSGSAGALFALDSTNVYYFTGNSLVSQPIRHWQRHLLRCQRVLPVSRRPSSLPDGGTDQQIVRYDSSRPVMRAHAAAALAMAQAKSFCISIGPGSGTPTQLASTGANGCVDSLVLNGRHPLLRDRPVQRQPQHHVRSACRRAEGVRTRVASQQQSQNGGGGILRPER